MEFTLRAAHKLVEKINGHLKTIEVEPIVNVNAFEVADAQKLFSERLARFNANRERALNLIEIRAVLRNEIGEQNAKEIDGLIGHRKAAIERLTLFNRILQSAKQEGEISSPAALEKKVKAQTDSKTQTLYGREMISFNVVSKEVRDNLESEVAVMKRLIERTEDQLLHENIQRKIVLDAARVGVLRQELLV